MPSEPQPGDVPAFKSFSALEVYFETFQRQAIEFFNRVLGDDLGAAEVADRTARFLFRLFQLQEDARRWLDAFDGGRRSAVPSDFNTIRCVHLIVRLFTLEGTFHLTAIDVYVFAGDLDGAGASYEQGDKALRMARPYLRRLEGHWLMRWWSVLKRRVTLRRTTGIEDLRKQLSENRSILRGYASLLGDPAVLDAAELRKAIVEANDTVVGVVRELFREPDKTVRYHGVNGLAGRLIKLMELQMVLVPLPAAFSTRRAMASLLVAAAYLHWGMALAILPRNAMGAGKQLLYARRALDQSHASYRRALQLILTTPLRWIVGTYARAEIPGWRRLLPKGRELRRLQQHLRRHLQE